MTAARCWACSSQTKPFWTNDQFTAVECAKCGHIQVEHQPAPQTIAEDYHRNYDQDGFLASLAVTRRRQAERLLDALAALGPIDGLFDYGCGRGWLLEIAKRRGVTRLAGGDVSELALQLLREKGIQDVPLAPSPEPQRPDFEALGFLPQVVTLLDVVEHFPGDLTSKFTPWIAGLPASVRVVVFKVPIREGLLFTLADGARRVGIEGIGRRLFQAGTHPPHYQYFTRRSLESFVSQIGLKPLRTIDDLDFEPQELGHRLPAGLAPLRALAAPAGRLLSAVAETLGRTDSRIVIAARPC